MNSLMNQRQRNAYTLLTTVYILTFMLLATVPHTTAISENDIQFITADEFLDASGDYASEMQSKISTAPRTYLSDEDIVFYVDLPGYDILDISLICLDNNNMTPIILDKQRWMNGTYLAAYNLRDYRCGHFYIQVEYLIENEVYKITKEIRTEKFSRVLEHVMDSQQIDGSFIDPLSTAYAVWGMSHYRTLFPTELSRSLSWLKDNRDNQLKCWPKDDCNVKTTAQILAILNEADYNNTYRIVWDGNAWLVSTLNQIKHSKKWEINVTAIADTGCLLRYALEESSNVSTDTNSSSNETATNETTSAGLNGTITSANFYLKKDASKLFYIEAENGRDLTVSCTDNIRFLLRDYQNNTVYLTSDKEVKYQIRNKCWNQFSQWGECDTETSLYGVLTSINESYKEDTKDWLISQLKENRITGEYIGENQFYDYSTVVESSLFLRIFSNMTEVKDWLHFTQNNDGSWGKQRRAADRVLDTAYALWSLQFLENESEVVKDGRTWLSLNEPDEGWGSVEKNVMVYQALYNNIKPFLKAEPNVLILDGNELTVKISNPTFFNIEDIQMVFENDLSNYITAESIEAMPPFSFKTIKVTKKDIPAGRYYGHILFTSNSTGNLLRLPVIVIRYPEIDLKVKDQPSYVFGQRGTIDFMVKKTAGEFRCVLEWKDEDFTSDKEVTVNSQNEISVNIQFNELAKRKKSYKGLWACYNPDKTTTIPFEVEIAQYVAEPLTFETGSIEVTSPRQGSPFMLTNNLDEPLEVELSFRKPEQYFSFSESTFTLQPFESREVAVESRLPKISRQTLSTVFESNNAIVASALKGKWTSELPFTLSITDYANRYKMRMLMIYALSTVGIVSLMGGLSYVFRRQLMVEWAKMMAHLNARWRYAKAYATYLKKGFTIGMLSLVPQKIRERVGFLNRMYEKAQETPPEQLGMPGRSVEFQKAGAESAGGMALPDMPSMTKAPSIDEHIIDLVRIMKSLHKTEEQIRQQLMKEGFHPTEVDMALQQLATLEKEAEKRVGEEKILQVIDAMEGSEDDIKKILKSKGIEDLYIDQAFKRIDVKKKEDAQKAGIPLTKEGHLAKGEKK